jgi:hypothetical protein
VAQSALARELRENAAYVRDDGWVSSARLMGLAADEIERLEDELARAKLRRRKPRFAIRVRSAIYRICSARP